MAQVANPSSLADTSSFYTGPSVEDMVANHSLAENIVRYHNDPCPILDPSELVLLRRFVSDPTACEQILQDCNMLGATDGNVNNKFGSLVGGIIIRHRAGVTRMITDDEIRELKQWFDSGVPDERMKGFAETGKGTVDEQGLFKAKSE